jgi:hypothetical protein
MGELRHVVGYFGRRRNAIPCTPVRLEPGRASAADDVIAQGPNNRTRHHKSRTPHRLEGRLFWYSEARVGSSTADVGDKPNPTAEGSGGRVLP